jgi:transcriptional regulator with XRE-family HTH domain
MMKGARLARLWRLGQGISQKQAAIAAGFGGKTGQSAWSRLESGDFIPRADEAIRLERVTRGDVPCSSWVEERATKRARDGAAHSRPITAEYSERSPAKIASNG